MGLVQHSFSRPEGNVADLLIDSNHQLVADYRRPSRLWLLDPDSLLLSSRPVLLEPARVRHRRADLAYLCRRGAVTYNGDVTGRATVDPLDPPRGRSARPRDDREG